MLESLLCFEALDLMLGPDRIGWPDAINEHDFTGSAYIGENDIPTNIRIECTLTELNERQKRLFHPYLDYWDSSQECYAPMEDLPEPLDESRYALNCLRLEFESFYDTEEDEFNANTFFSKSPTDENGTKKALSKTNKREIGYLYLRPVRTGSRALSLERGSLLDIISQLKEIRTSSWEAVLGNLSGLGNQLDNTEFRDILGAIETKVRQFTPLVSEGKKSMQFEVTNLTRRHLRQTMTLFAGSEPSDALVPYKQLGTGTINVMLFALMTQIAELKRTKDRNVIFAMEEPEIALPPHTQRRIIDELFTVSNQTLVTSHSPYVTERFIGKRIVVLKHSPEGLNGYCVDTDLIKEKTLRADFRQRYAEGLLSKAVIVVEGISDELVIEETARKLATFRTGFMPLDVAGVTVVNNNGWGNLEATGKFFKSLEIKTFAFHDDGASADPRYFDLVKVHPYRGIEKLLVEEIPLSELDTFLFQCQAYPDYPSGITLEAGWGTKEKVYAILKRRKGEGYAAKLIALCDQENKLPKTIIEFLENLVNAPTTISTTAASAGRSE